MSLLSESSNVREIIETFDTGSFHKYATYQFHEHYKWHCVFNILHRGIAEWLAFGIYTDETNKTLLYHACFSNLGANIPQDKKLWEEIRKGANAQSRNNDALLHQKKDNCHCSCSLGAQLFFVLRTVRKNVRSHAKVCCEHAKIAVERKNGKRERSYVSNECHLSKLKKHYLCCKTGGLFFYLFLFTCWTVIECEKYIFNLDWSKRRKQNIQRLSIILKIYVPTMWLN